jgi:integrase
MPVREGQLVCQHLENVSRDVLQHYSEIIRTFVRGRHGIYALYRKNRLYYVGLATNLRARINQHLRDRHAETWDHFSLYLTVGHQHLREIECLLVRIGRPRGNRTKPQFLRSENLRPGLRRQVSECQRRELKELFPGATRPHAEPQTGKERELPRQEGRRLAYLAGRDDAERALFLNRSRERFSVRGIALLVNRYLRAAGITDRSGPHLLRHTFATHALRARPNLRAVQELLGHAWVTTTQRYTHLEVEDLQAQVADLPANR